MRLLYVCRLFTGLESTLEARRWTPAGIPGIFKLIEGLEEAGHDLHLVLTCKDARSTWTAVRDTTLAIQGIGREVQVLSGYQYLLRRLGRLAGWWRELRQLGVILLRARRLRPDLVYIDHANVWAGAILARFTSIPIVFRVMGVYPVMRQALDDGRFSYRLLRWCYSSPWSLVICTEDGSGSRLWLQRALAPAVPRRLLVNGVDVVHAVPAEMPPISPDSIVVLFVGKLEHPKGAAEFLDGFLSAQAQQQNLHALIVGEGSLRGLLTERIAQAGAAERVTLLGRVPHRVMPSILGRADIYVSLNRLGNLSNANLEAMRAGIATILPMAQPEIGIDVETDRLLGPDTALRIPAVEDHNALVAAIVRLATSPIERMARGAALAAAVQGFAGDWSRRVAQEIAMIERAAVGYVPPAQLGRT